MSEELDGEETEKVFRRVVDNTPELLEMLEAAYREVVEGDPRKWEIGGRVLELREDPEDLFSGRYSFASSIKMRLSLTLVGAVGNDDWAWLIENFEREDIMGRFAIHLKKHFEAQGLFGEDDE